MEDYVLFLIKELNSVADIVYIVINGIISDDGLQILEKNADHIIVRDNAGFDAGAYKSVISSEKYIHEIENADRLILCNDTFFGPFVPFAQIFNKMPDHIDFWGMNYVGNCPFDHLQSYFLVMEKEAIHDTLVYFNNYVHESESDIREIYATLETGLFNYLCSMGHRWGSYVESEDIDIYKSGDLAIIKYGLPILKKKFFLEADSINNVKTALSYIRNRTNYNIYLVLDCIRHEYGVELKERDLSESETEYMTSDAVYMSHRNVSEEALSDFFKNENVYIYGEGIIARKVYNLYSHFNCFRGFVVTDNTKLNRRILYGLPVDEYDGRYDSKNVIVALNKNNTAELINQIGHKINWMYLW